MLLLFVVLSQEKRSHYCCFAIYVKTEQKSSTNTHCSQLASILLSLGTLQHIGAAHSCNPGDPQTIVLHL